MNDKLKLAELIAKLLDSQFRILGFKFGLDPLLGLIPGVGDVVSAMFSIYLIKIGQEMRLPQREINKMWIYLAADIGLGLVPVLGDALDFVFKSNQLNLEILRKYKKGQIVIEGEIVD